MKPNQLLAEVISRSMEMTPADKATFLKLVEDWERGQDTLSRIEPPSDHAEDEALLKTFDTQDAAYDQLYSKAPSQVNKAMDIYLDFRDSFTK